MNRTTSNREGQNPPNPAFSIKEKVLKSEKKSNLANRKPKARLGCPQLPLLCLRLIQEIGHSRSPYGEGRSARKKVKKEKKKRILPQFEQGKNVVHWAYEDNPRQNPRSSFSKQGLLGAETGSFRSEHVWIPDFPCRRETRARCGEKTTNSEFKNKTLLF